VLRAMERVGYRVIFAIRRIFGQSPNLTIQQLKATQKELEELKDSINKMYKLLTEEITDKDL